MLNEPPSTTEGQAHRYVTRHIPVLSFFTIQLTTEPRGNMARPFTLFELEIQTIPYETLANLVLSR